jgi:hypothetical protein
MRMVAPDSFGSYTNKLHRGMVTCRGNNNPGGPETRSFTANGLTKITLSHSCTAETNTHIFTAAKLDQRRDTAGQEEARQEQQHGDSRAQPGYSGQKQPRGDQPPAGTPQAQLPTAHPEATTNNRKTRQSRKKALKCYWSRVFRQRGVVGYAAEHL